MSTHQIPKDGLKGLQENWKSDLVSGFIVFLIALPLCLGIATASGFPPFAGLITAMVGGILVSPIMGARLTIKGPAAGLIVIAIGSFQALGYEKSLAVIAVAGVIQILFALVKAGKLSDFFPAAAVHGMLAAIGIIVFSKQIHTLVGVKATAKEPLALLAEIPNSFAHMNTDVFIIGIVSLIILFGLPMIKNKIIKMIPAPLIVLLVAIPLGFYFNIGATNPKFLVTLPTDFLSGFAFPDWSAILSGDSIKYIIMFALVGTIESLLTAKAIDGLDPYHRKTDFNRDILAVGIGNTVSGLLGGLPMIAEVARSSANVNNGAKTRWSNFFHGTLLLIFVAFFPKFINKIPMSALAAMLISIAYKLASPKTFSDTFKVGKEQLVIFCATLIVTLATDLLVGIGAGILVKLIINFLMGAHLPTLFKVSYLESKVSDEVYQLSLDGSLTFTNAISLNNKLATIPRKKHLIINIEKVKLIDHTTMHSLTHFKSDYIKEGGTCTIEGLHKMRKNSDHPHSVHKSDKAIA